MDNDELPLEDDKKLLEEQLEEIEKSSNDDIEIAEDTANEAEAPVDVPAEDIPTEAPIEEHIEAEKPVEAADVSPTIEEVPAPTNPTPDDEVKPSEKKSKKPLIIVLLIALLILLGSSIAVFILLNKEPDDSDVVVIDEPEVLDLTMSNSLSDFDLFLLKSADEKEDDENFVYSPLSIKYALGMLKEGAGGTSKSEITKVMADYEIKKYENNDHRSLANAFFVNESKKDEVLDSYIDGLKTNYDANIVSDKFENAKTINDWVEKNTLGIIKNFLQDEQVEGRDFVLVNALAIDMAWKNMIQCSLDTNNKDDIPCLDYEVDYAHEKYADSVGLANLNGNSISFGSDENNKEDVQGLAIGASINRYDIVSTLGSDTIRSTVEADYRKWLKSDEAKNVIENAKQNGSDITSEEEIKSFLDKYMTEIAKSYKSVDYSTDYQFYVDDDTKVFAKDLREYDGTTLQYIAIMPTETKLGEYIKSLKAEEVGTLINNLKEIKEENFTDGVITQIKGRIPVFKYDYGFDNLIPDMEKIGISEIFSEDADLSGMFENGGDYIDLFTQKSDIEFSNLGIRAAAATAIGGKGSGTPYDYSWDVPIETIDLTFDKPFIYLIRDKDTGEIWFTGAIYEPTPVE